MFSRRLTGRGEGHALADITHLLGAEGQARQRNKRRRNAQQVQAELRMYARYVNEERLTQTTRQPLFFANRSQPFSARSLSFPRKRESTDAAMFSS